MTRRLPYPECNWCLLANKLRGKAYHAKNFRLPPPYLPQIDELEVLKWECEDRFWRYYFAPELKKKSRNRGLEYWIRSSPPAPFYFSKVMSPNDWEPC